MKKKTGGTAFPNVDYNGQGDGEASSGMTLRDYFAAKAMQGMCAGTDWMAGREVNCISMAESAYEIADALLEARTA